MEAFAQHVDVFVGGEFGCREDDQVLDRGIVGMRRLTGTPARTSAWASISTIGAAGTGRRIVISLKKLVLRSSTPGTARRALERPDGPLVVEAGKSA